MQEQVTVFYDRSRLQLAEHFASARSHRRVSARTHCHRRVHVCHCRAAVPPPVGRAVLCVPPSPWRPPASLRKITTHKLLSLRSMSHQLQRLLPEHWRYVTYCIVMLCRALQNCIDNALQARVAPSISVSNLYNNATAVQNAPAPISLPTFMPNYKDPAPMFCP